MLFSLEAVQALYGDSLLLHFGTPAEPQLVLIDGGPGTVYEKHLKPRLLQLKQARAGANAPLPIRLMMISHIDDDHINGILAMLRDLDALSGRGPLPFAIENFWFNSFDDIVGREAQELAVPQKKTGAGGAGGGIRTAAAGTPPPPDADLEHTARLVLASVTQGRDVRNLAKRLAIPMNRGVGGKLVMLPTKPQPFEIDGLSLTVVAPSKARKDALNEKWDKELQKKGLAKTAAYLDNAVENLSSIVVLADMGKGAARRSMLLTGDARGDDVLEGLREVGRLKGNKPLKLDVVKLQHHGSIRNIDRDFVELLPARHYVASANGKFENPDLETMKLITGIRKDDEFTIHLTNHTPWLDKFFADEKKKGRKYRVDYGEGQGGRVMVNLGDPPTK